MALWWVLPVAVPAQWQRARSGAELRLEARLDVGAQDGAPPLLGLGPKQQTRVPSNAGGSRLGLDTTGQVTGHPKPAGAFTTPAIVKKGNEIQR